VFRSGYWTLMRVRGAPVRLHWSIPVVAVVFDGFRFQPGFILGFVLLVLLHELGHALLVWRTGHRVIGIEVTGLGGACAWAGDATAFERSLIAWGGVLMQAALYAAVWIALRVGGPPPNAFLWSLLSVFLGANLWLIAINLIPIPPLDGAEAWQLFQHWKRRRGPVPHGSWRDPGKNAQRAWLDQMQNAPPKRRKKRKRRERVGSIPDDAKPSRDAQRAIDELMRKARSETKDEE
jgi:hypothetical protein